MPAHDFVKIGKYEDFLVDLTDLTEKHKIAIKGYYDYAPFLMKTKCVGYYSVNNNGRLQYNKLKTFK
jgi:hypothetical protein